jgi:tetratricopeptide (TPR) repeat protein
MAAKAQRSTCSQTEAVGRRKKRVLNSPIFLILAFASLAGCHREQVASDPAGLFDAARTAYQTGDFVRARECARTGYLQFEHKPQSEWYWKFKLLYAEMHLWNGDTAQAERLLAQPPPAAYIKLTLHYRMLKGYVLFRTQQTAEAEKLLKPTYEKTQAQGDYELAADIQLLRAQFLPDAQQAERASVNALKIAADHNLRFQQSAAHLDLGLVLIRRSRFGDAIPEFQQASTIAVSIGAKMLNAFATGNIATCYYNLGDFTRALRTRLDLLPMQTQAGLSTALRDSYLEIGNIYLLQRQNDKAVEYFRQALALVRQTDTPAVFASLAAGIAQALASSGALDEAERYNREGLNACNKNDKGQLAALTLNQALIAARRAQHQQAAAQYAEAIRLGQDDPPILWQAYSGLALENAALGDRSTANRNFEQALNVIEQNRSEQLVTDYKITFLSQLIRFYQEYVALLISEGDNDRALEIADSSRAGVLTEDLLGQSAARRSGLAAEIRRIAKASDATFLYYWLAPKRSYLWVISPNSSRLLPLPGAQQIDRDVQSYRHFLEEEKRNPLDSVNPAGKRLFESLVAPASIPKGSKVVIVPDGSLHNLNFETLPVYGAPVSEPRASASSNQSSPPAHYWLEDAVVSIAPSLSILGLASDHAARTRSLLLIGDTLTQGTGFAPLPQASLEVDEIKKQFAADRIVAYTGAAATAAAYRAAHPEQFSNIHFAAHADANEQRPLDSAIILSPEQNTWKLYARDVADIPLHADLVTISACRGAGARTLSGEGLVGFAWAFFQAGARNVVTSLWDVNDRSTADLMNSFYRYIAAGKSYPDALREAKLQMLEQYRKPYYWGAFQLYSRYLTARTLKRHEPANPIESAAAAVHH